MQEDRSSRPSWVSWQDSALKYQTNEKSLAILFKHIRMLHHFVSWGPGICLWQGRLRLSLGPFKLRYHESKGFANEQRPRTGHRWILKVFEEHIICVLWLQSQNTVPGENGMNKQLTHFRAGCGKGQFWQEEQLLGQGNQGWSMWCWPESAFEYMYTHTWLMRVLASVVFRGHVWGQSGQQMISPDLRSQGLEKHPRGYSYGE